MKKAVSTKRKRKAWEVRLRKLRNKITVTFESLQDRDAIAPTILGQTYRVAQEKSELSEGQVAYRQQIARKLYNLPKRVGFAKQWRDGGFDKVGAPIDSPTGEFVRYAQGELLPSVQAMLLRDLPAKRLHPTPQVVEEQPEKVAK